MTDVKRRLERRVRALLFFFIVALVLSGVTAFPLNTELSILSGILGIDSTRSPEEYSGLRYWIATVAEGLRETDARYPFIAYGTDWLAFGHIVIALFFVGPLKDPIGNRWVVSTGMIACVGVIPLAVIAGAIRGIPLYWQLIDCSFGVFGFITLWVCRKSIVRLESLR